MKKKLSAHDDDSSTIICYHFYPHYRKGVIDELEQEISPTFLGDIKGVEGIKPYVFNKCHKFIHSKCFYIGKIMLQPSLIWVALTGNFRNFIFLANPNHLTTWLAALICKARKKNVIFWGHGFKSTEKSRSNKIRKLFFGIANSFYTYGWRAKLNAVDLGFTKETIHVGFNSLDYNLQLEIRNKLPAPLKTSPNELNIICISRLTQICRYDLLLDAIKEAKKINNTMQFSVTFIGDGPARKELESIASEFEIKSSFLGEIYDEKIIASHISAADVTISPGKIGLTAMHSLMYGTPVISNNNFINQMPEVEAIVEGYTGEFFEQNKITSLTNILITFKEKYPNKSKTRQDCFLMIDQIYNPKKQVHILKRAIQRKIALEGNDAFSLFSEKTNDGTRTDS